MQGFKYPLCATVLALCGSVTAPLSTQERDGRPSGTPKKMDGKWLITNRTRTE